MATIPQVVDIRRPSLRTDRVDLPGAGELAVSDAVLQAANTFTAVLGEKKEKDNRLAYSLVKQKLLLAELNEREKLQGDPNWETYIDRYRAGIKEARTQIFSEAYGLSPSDRVLADAEADLIVERGAAAITEYTRARMIDSEMAEGISLRHRLQEKIFLAEPFTRNDTMFTAVDSIQAEIDAGYREEDEGELAIQEWIGQVAERTLQAMPPEERLNHVTMSLAGRKVGGAITREDIRKGKGTDSIADFLPTDVLERMKEVTEEQVKEENTLEQGQALSDQSYAKFGDGLGEAKARDKDVRDNAKTAEERNAGLEINRRRYLMEKDARQEEQQGAEDELYRLISEEAYGPSQLPSDLLATVRQGPSGGQRADAVIQRAKHWTERKGFAQVENLDAMEVFTNLPKSEQAKFTLDGRMPEELRPVEGALLPPPATWRESITFEQGKLMTAAAEQARLAVEAGRGEETGLSTFDSMVDRELEQILDMTKPTASSGKDYKEKWSGPYTAVHYALLQEGQRLNKELTYDEKLRVFKTVIQGEVMLRRTAWWDRAIRVMQLTPEQEQQAYIHRTTILPLSGQNAIETEVIYEKDKHGVEYKGTMWEFLRQHAKASGLDLQDEDTMEAMEEALYYLVYQGPGEAIKRLQGVAGY